MSSNLRWTPAVIEREEFPKQIEFSVRLRVHLLKRYGFKSKFTVDVNDISYIEGLRDEGCPGAQDLIDAIERYGEISVNTEE